MARELSAPELTARSYEGMLAVAQRVQLAVGVVGLVALWLLPGVPASDKATVTALLLGVYLPWTLIGALTANTPGAAARIANLVADLLAIGVFALVIPDTRTAVMTAYVLMVAFHAYVSGRTAGLLVTVGVLAVGTIAELRAPPSERVEAFTIVMYATVLVALTVMVDGLAGERRRLVRHLSRLHDALQGVSADPHLPGTLESVARGAKEAVGAVSVEVLTEVDQRSTSPAGLAMMTGRAITVADVADDPRFIAWTPPEGQARDGSMVVVPIGAPERPLGTLSAYWSRRGAFDDDDVMLLVAYARQAGLAVARAVAFDREKEAAAQLADTDRTKSEFVARVSHELRTPLTAISGFIATVLLHWENLDDEAKRDLLGRASRNAAELRRMVEQVLAFARSGETEIVLSMVDCELASEVDGIVDQLTPILADHPVEVSIDPAIAVTVDREALHHVLTNLLSNAAKFSPGPSPIHVSARSAGGEVEVSVRDHGPGVSDDDKARVFDRFYRGSSVSAKGTGIGLSIVRSFVDQLGGRVWVESPPGDGATFRFTLRAAHTPHAAERNLLVG